MTLRFLTSGESHGPAVVAILEGLPAGLPLAVETINQELARRQAGYGAGPRMKIEQDRAQILGGVMAGLSTGAPVAVLVANRDHEKWRGKPIASFTIPRPGHADLSGALKYGYRDLRPALERASARETAARVAVGAICRQLLAHFGVRLGGYVCAIGSVRANLDAIPLSERLDRVAYTPGQEPSSPVNCPDLEASRRMQAEIDRAMRARDTLGGVIEVVALNLPPGLGSYVHWERRLDARLGAAILSIPAIKGVEIGAAFENASLYGTQAHDSIRLDGKNLIRPTGRDGGLEGGITTGQPLLARAAMKPIATTLTPQQSVDLAAGQEVDTRYERSDFCPTPRAVVVVEAMVAFVLADALLEKLGGDSLAEMQPRFAALRQARLSDLAMDAGEHEWWPI